MVWYLCTYLGRRQNNNTLSVAWVDGIDAERSHPDKGLLPSTYLLCYMYAPELSIVLYIGT